MHFSFFPFRDICSPTGNSKNPRNFLHFQQGKRKIDNCHTPAACCCWNRITTQCPSLRQTKKVYGQIIENYGELSCKYLTIVSRRAAHKQNISKRQMDSRSSSQNILLCFGHALNWIRSKFCCFMKEHFQSCF